MDSDSEDDVDGFSDGEEEAEEFEASHHCF
jgi:hypothetical protein